MSIRSVVRLLKWSAFSQRGWLMCSTLLAEGAEGHLRH
jgi:hypothetical protein